VGKHVNIYENLREAQMRLRSTVVCYDRIPYHVTAITDHKGDGVFRIYLDPMNFDAGKSRGGLRPDISHFNPEAHQQQIGEYMDKWMENNKDSGFLRKKMNSPSFNRFRPFPLGMINQGTSCYYLERQPVRQREQGLTRSMVYENKVSLSDSEMGRKYPGLNNVDMWHPSFRLCVIGDYPSADEVLRELKDPETVNEAVAFHRQFAIVRGPMDLLFLAYKEFIIGLLPEQDFSVLKLGRQFQQYREVTQELGLFGKIIR
jgi:hypothetical protein